jgi:hypothetical protein
MSELLRMDKMGPCVLSWDLEACRMSNEALPDEEVAARVREAVSGDFQPEHVNSFPMKPGEGYYDLVSPSSHYRLPIVFGSIVSFLLILRSMFVLLGGNRF